MISITPLKGVTLTLVPCWQAGYVFSTCTKLDTVWVHPWQELLRSALGAANGKTGIGMVKYALASPVPCVPGVRHSTVPASVPACAVRPIWSHCPLGVKQSCFLSLTQSVGTGLLPALTSQVVLIMLMGWMFFQAGNPAKRSPCDRH